MDNEKPDVKKYINDFFREQPPYSCLEELYDDYKDIDGVEGSKPRCPEYYKDLAKYLNVRVSSYGNNFSFNFLCPNDEIIEADDRKIALIESSNPILLLTSDTFGFSVSSKKNYPYGKIDKSDVSFAKKCIEDTRTIGGAFLWPVMMTYNEGWIGPERANGYNLARGVGKHEPDGYYIEDRVDLTLLELKHYYLIAKSKLMLTWRGDYPRDVLPHCLNIEMDYWLMRFNSFNEYVEFFMFHPFVVKIDSSYYPIDIFNSKIPEKDDSIEKKDYILEPDKREPRIRVIKEAPKTKEIQSCEDGDKIKRMLNNVRLLTLARSRMMTAFINNPDKDYWKEYDPKWTEADIISEEKATPSES